MCGLQGSVKSTGDSISDSFLEALDSIHHRGPDDTGLFNCRLDNVRIDLGFKRLSIIDLSHGGHQPIKSSDERYCLIFNGEIYNYIELRSQLLAKGHQFKTTSDSEVLLNAWIEWGQQSLTKFLGMYAFAILDLKEKKLTLVRDAFGIKPLFYAKGSNGFFFGSEIQQLRTLSGEGKEPNFQKTIDYLQDGIYDEEEQTFFRGILRLKPGHLLTLQINGNWATSDQERWFEFEKNESIPPSRAVAASSLREMILESVDLHMRSDVPIAAALSGGVDSSILVSCMRYLRPNANIHTFSYLADSPVKNEAHWVNLMNSKITAESHFVEFNRDEFLSEVDELILTQSEPFGSTSIYAQFKLFQEVKESGFKVLLEGQGADELFAGYHGYQNFRIMSLVEKQDFLQLLNYVCHWASIPGRPVKSSVLYLFYELLPHELKSYVKEKIKPRMEYPWLNSSNPALDHKQIDIPQRSLEFWGSRVIEELREQLTSRGLPALLRHSDRSSMHFSVESRVPFLTTKIANYSMSLPERYHSPNTGISKSLLRESMEGLVPNEVLYRKDKIGFETPENDLLDASILIETIKRHRFSDVSLLNPSLLVSEFAKQKNNSQTQTRQIWRIFNLIRWAELHDIEI